MGSVSCAAGCPHGGAWSGQIPNPDSLFYTYPKFMTGGYPGCCYGRP